MTRSQKQWKATLSIIIVGSAILLLFELGNAFPSLAAIRVAVITGLFLLFGALALWLHANRSADGSEWWQDEDPSGWRGY